MLRHFFVLAFSLVPSVLAFAGCASTDECIAGKACKCSGDSCNQTCEGDGRGCAFECGPGQSCAFSCPNGGCGMTCDGSDSCVIDCPGGGCNAQCSGGTQACEVTGCQTGCGLQCGGAPVCQSSCTPLSGGCATTP